MGLTTLSLMHIAAALEAREPTETIFKRYTIENRRFVQLIGAALALTFLVTALAPLQRIFDTVSLTSAQWGVCLLGPIVFLAVAESGSSWSDGAARAIPLRPPTCTDTDGGMWVARHSAGRQPSRRRRNGVAFLRSPCSRWDSAPFWFIDETRCRGTARSPAPVFGNSPEPEATVGTEAIEHVPRERVSSRSRGWLNSPACVISRRSMTAIERAFAGTVNDTISSSFPLSKPKATAIRAALGRIPVTPGCAGEPPADLDARRERGIEGVLQEPDVSDKRRDSQYLDSPRSGAAFSEQWHDPLPHESV